MKITLLLSLTMLGASAALSSAATITIKNGDFQSNNSGNPDDWTTVENGGDKIYLWGNGAGGVPAGEIPLAFKDVVAGDNYILQDMTANNAGLTAQSYGTWNIRFDYGWRTNSSGDDAKFKVSLIDMTTNAILGSDDSTVLSTTPKVSNHYTPVGTANITINYDQTQATSNNIGIRIERTDAADGADYNSTAYIDNVAVTTVPEPSSMALLGLGGLALLLRRRK